jgi:hypothetical protein
LEAGSGSRAESSPRNAILGFIVIGLPCMWYTIFGRFTLKDELASHGSDLKSSDKVETIDADI